MPFGWVGVGLELVSGFRSWLVVTVLSTAERAASQKGLFCAACGAGGAGFASRSSRTPNWGPGTGFTGVG